ncbi:MAG TPA: metal ABC transporter permease [Oscillatoriales cyanobacterium M59_W2019_021]|nr:metal ABC transporter permease [Oscillatoriales cyanobacterium M4454_W2019_049]HIK49438.1 metal ABC transporter permease [Oscillatoriales cyanobacterium M59_W2019_021]
MSLSILGVIVVGQWLVEPLQFQFVRNALAISVLLGILCAIVGTYLIVQEKGMMSCVISHAILPGISIAFFLGINLSIGAFIAGVISAFFVVFIRASSRIKIDTAMSLILSSFLGLGIILITVLKTNKLDLSNLLFGDILGVTTADVWETAVITAIVLILTKLFYKELQFYTFDPLGARAIGLPVNTMYFGLICAITLAIVASMQTVGVLLVMALLTGPAATAYLIVKELHEMMIVGSIFGILSGAIGMYFSYHWDLPSGPAIVMVIFALFLLALLLSPSQGILTRSRRRSTNP